MKHGSTNIKYLVFPTVYIKIYTVNNWQVIIKGSNFPHYIFHYQT